MLEFVDVSKSYDGGETFAVANTSLKVAEGEFLVVLGSSGSGKTTLLRMANGLVQPTSGEVLYHGTPIAERELYSLRREIGYVVQDGGLFPHFTVWENISAVLRLKGKDKSQRRQRASKLLEEVHLPQEYMDRFPDELSGGEQQRVGVARALANNPAILLMDEPFGALDAVTREQLQQVVKKLQIELQKTVMFITHDIFEALELADRVAVMHEGTLRQVGRPRELTANPADEYVRALFEKPAEILKRFSESESGEYS